MKKIILFILVFSSALTLVACSQGMKITKAKWTEEEKNMIELLKEEEPTFVFDFAVDDTVNHVTINSYELDENGKWKLLSGGGGERLYNKTGRIILDFDVIGNGMSTTVQSENQMDSWEYTSNQMIDTKNNGIAISSLMEDTEIVYEKEIPLVVQSMTPLNSGTGYTVEHFFEPQVYVDLNYEHIYAVTVVFSQKPIKSKS